MCTDMRGETRAEVERDGLQDVPLLWEVRTNAPWLKGRMNEGICITKWESLTDKDAVQKLNNGDQWDSQSPLRSERCRYVSLVRRRREARR